MDDFDKILGNVDLQVPRVRVVLVPVMAHREAARAGRNQVFQAHPGDRVQLERAEHAIGMALDVAAHGLGNANDVHTDIVCGRVVHCLGDQRDLDQVGPNATLPAARDGHRLARVRTRRGCGDKHSRLAEAAALAARLEMQGEMETVVSRDFRAAVHGPLAAAPCAADDLLPEVVEGLADRRQIPLEEVPQCFHRRPGRPGNGVRPGT
mmetsp:Transcript_93725/g.264585  ORF Transcript_93725/g.264585 Transcript_93725/m.264585 type:complete len:208 (-) Transcript_93725:90-713(-)